jgi:hypothetical protein
MLGSFGETPGAGGRARIVDPEPPVPHWVRFAAAPFARVWVRLGRGLFSATRHPCPGSFGETTEAGSRPALPTRSLQTAIGFVPSRRAAGPGFVRGAGISPPVTRDLPPAAPARVRSGKRPFGDAAGLLSPSLKIGFVPSCRRERAPRAGFDRGRTPAGAAERSGWERAGARGPVVYHRQGRAGGPGQIAVGPATDGRPGLARTFRDRPGWLGSRLRDPGGQGANSPGSRRLDPGHPAADPHRPDVGRRVARRSPRRAWASGPAAPTPFAGSGRATPPARRPRGPVHQGLVF